MVLNESAKETSPVLQQVMAIAEQETGMRVSFDDLTGVRNDAPSMKLDEKWFANSSHAIPIVFPNVVVDMIEQPARAVAS